jgi:hypothetical protein
MTHEWEIDVENESFMDKAKFLYATKIRGESRAEPKTLFISVEQTAIRQYAQRVRMNLLGGLSNGQEWILAQEPRFLMQTAEKRIVARIHEHTEMVRELIKR